MLYFTEDDHAIAILHLVEHGDSDGGYSISGSDWHVIEDLQESGALVPTADIAGDWVNDVVTGQTRDRYPEDIVLSIAASLQERSQAFLDLIPSLLFPRDSCFVHFIDDNYKLLDS